MENPAVVSAVPQKISKDYTKIWARFLTGKEDAKVEKDLDKILKKQKTFDPALTIKGYTALYKGNDAAASQEFTKALSLNPKNRIALYYLAELAYAHNEYSRAADLYSRLLAIDTSRSDAETKRQRALLLAIDELVRSADRAVVDSRLTEAEDFYRRSLRIAPNEPTLHARLADLLDRQNKKAEAESEHKIAEALSPRNAARTRTVDATKVDGPKPDSLEDLGRWGSDIETFHLIRNAQTVTREQFAMLILRYFPQTSEFRQRPQILTDIQNSSAKSEIQTIAGVGLIEPFPNHTFGPASPLTRSELATALARLSRLLGLSPQSKSQIPASDVAPTNAQYPEIQLALGYGLVAVENSGSFNLSGYVSGQEAVSAADRLLGIFQQSQR
jgi:tetratricopeptide (TPR) repeat protein